MERCYHLDVQYSNIRNQASLSSGHLILQVRSENTPEQRERILNGWYREQQMNKLPDAIQKCEQIVGVPASEWKIKIMRTKWGTCNIEKKESG